jgi:hypothetical protein
MLKISEARPSIRLRINKKALLWTLAIFLVEVFIALNIHDEWVRPYGGDVLATLLVYTGLKTVCFRTKSGHLALISFGIGTIVELLQLVQLTKRLGWDQYIVLRVVMGTTFHWGDLLAYALGVLAAWYVDKNTTMMRSGAT